MPGSPSSYGARVAKFFRGGGASPRRGDPDRRSKKGGRWDASRSPPLDDTVYRGRSRGSSPESCDSISLDSSTRSEVAYKAPSRVRFDQSKNTVHEAAAIEDPALLWWTADERRDQLARTEWVVALETKRRLLDEPRDPIPGESRRGLGIACEPSTPSIRAEKIAQHRRGVLAAAAVADGDDVAHLAQSLSAEAVAVARQMGDADHRAVMTEVATPDMPLECLQRRDSLARLDLFGDSIKLAKGAKGGLASALDADPYEMASELARSDVSVGSYESTRSWKETDAMDSTNYGSSPESF
ncbi:unnamed protein product [Pelagomonas calceolata]|uniref:Uncharacterized protein n=1 Tax=Pelagomonas calceolata TaxID=35677 RepID=A0A7S3ZW01_9STRA|nr:unnamed protein product [Pelagomonas calceolata]|mmetsp:Transcript_1726/g.4950  ORF Transcript_1726/g.4950 Transcript_1726/m.4950 type:complete len:298 (-) Transcript_1726:128-1021(-)